VYSQVEQRRKEALSRTSEDVLSASENTLHDVVSRYSFMDLWPCSSKELDYLVRQEVCAIQLILKLVRFIHKRLCLHSCIGCDVNVLNDQIKLSACESELGHIWNRLPS
jgi:hypothetical protein